jgi:hypothetical protein
MSTPYSQRRYPIFAPLPPKPVEEKLVTEGGRLITAELLDDVGACEEGVDAFNRLFPNGRVVVTERVGELLADNVADDDFDLDWVANNLLIEVARRRWHNVCELQLDVHEQLTQVLGEDVDVYKNLLVGLLRGRELSTHLREEYSTKINDTEKFVSFVRNELTQAIDRASARMMAYLISDNASTRQA